MTLAERIEVIEQACELTLAYAAQGGDRGGVNKCACAARDRLSRCVESRGGSHRLGCDQTELVRWLRSVVPAKPEEPSSGLARGPRRLYKPSFLSRTSTTEWT